MVSSAYLTENDMYRKQKEQIWLVSRICRDIFSCEIGYPLAVLTSLKSIRYLDDKITAREYT